VGTANQSSVSDDEHLDVEPVDSVIVAAGVPGYEETTVNTPLVDQDYTGITSVKGIAWVKAIGAKKISGTSKYAYLTIELSRNGVETGFDALGLYLARLDKDGYPIPELEWRHVRYIDAEHLNGTRAIAAHSGLSTLGVPVAQYTYDLSALPATPECNYDVSPAVCPAGKNAYNILGALKDNDFWIGFLPSRSTAHVRAVLSHDGGLTITDAVK